MKTLADRFTEILSPAIDMRAPYARQMLAALLVAAAEARPNRAVTAASEADLARAIAQADFIWQLGEDGVMACSPDLAGQMFDAAWNEGAAKAKFTHIAQCVAAFLKHPVAP